ncbi:hypothetical protein RDI58_004859 [Solanum bulbocastanum]|uniref:Uncharacterized protein n=1 Tax=Solanum bulbocastanum TaxID=147425 RepID=A0AAN8YM01_SOLBU
MDKFSYVDKFQHPSFSDSVLDLSWPL